MYQGKKGVWIVLGVAFAIFMGFMLFHSWKRSSYFYFDSHFPRLGSSDAAVQMVLIEEFTCPGCKRFSQKCFPKLKAAWLDSEKAEFILVLVGFTEEARRLGNAALAVLHQDSGVFFSFMEQLFKFPVNRPPNDMEILSLAQKFHTIDLIVLSQNMKERTYDYQLKENLYLAKKMMGRDIHTPALFINKKFMKSMDCDDITSYIEGRL